jgi:excinuclease ABC subunit B
MLSEIGHCKALKTTPPFKRCACRLAAKSNVCDYMPKTRYFWTESHVMMGQLSAVYNGDQARKTTLVDYGFACQCTG